MNAQRVSLATGVSLDVWTAGDPGNPAIIFLHGFPESHRTWRHQMAALSDQYYCIAPDQRGYARSDKPDGVDAYRVPLLIADVFAPFQGTDLNKAGPCLPLPNLLPLVGVLIDYGVPLPNVLPITGVDIYAYAINVHTAKGQNGLQAPLAEVSME